MLQQWRAIRVSVGVDTLSVRRKKCSAAKEYLTSFMVSQRLEHVSADLMGRNALQALAVLPTILRQSKNLC